MEWNTQNTTTIAVLIWMIISPILTNLGIAIDQAVFVTAITGVIGLLLAIKSAKHPNEIEAFGNGVDSDDSC